MKKEKVTIHEKNGKKYLRSGGEFAGRIASPAERQAPTKRFFGAKSVPATRAPKNSIDAASEIFKKLNLNGFDSDSVSQLAASEISRWDENSASMVSQARDSVKSGLNLSAIGLDTTVSVRESLSSVGSYLSRVLGTPIPA